ncbi:glycosyltransferase involved in cell wall biosynthesis [Enterococcus rotai]|nr:glycosyltransferase [Enterococcus rotai]
MSILHYTLGVPPYRTGGLTKYSIDLMETELEFGYKVCLLFPGSYQLSGKSKIKRKSDYNDITLFELINPLPIPLLNGIGEAKLFMKPNNEHLFLEFLSDNHIHLVHVHTLMGLPIEFLLAAKRLKIKIIYTSHDYYGLCPQILAGDIEYLATNCDVSCSVCGDSPFSKKLLVAMQTKTYKLIKDTQVVKFLRKRKKNSVAAKKRQNYSTEENRNQIKLRNYYLQMFSLVDLFHFNSELAKVEFEKFLQCDGVVVPITHKSIEDRRKEYIVTKNEPLKITYLGPQEVYKGFNLIYNTFQRLLEENINDWHLNFYGDDREPKDYNDYYFSFKGRYQQQQLMEIFNCTDLLVVPSVWKETFGFVALEALSYGIPILFSTNVGSSELINDNVTGFIFNPDVNDLKVKIQELLENRELINQVNKNILNMDITFDMKRHTKRILELYRKAGYTE